jgi:Pectate lyase superfamily protein
MFPALAARQACRRIALSLIAWVALLAPPISAQSPATSPDPWINVKEYGATGLGSPNDDAAAINSAINACPATGCTVFFPPGTYYIRSGLTIPNNKQSVQLLGAGGTSWNSTSASQIVSDQSGFYLLTAQGTNQYGPSIVNLGFRDISSGHNTVTGAIKLSNIYFFHLDYVACADFVGTGSNTNTGICVELDGLTDYTQFGTITQLVTVNTKFGVQTNNRTSAIVMLGGLISCAPLVGTNYISGSIGLDFGSSNRSEGSGVQNGEHWIGGVSINDCSVGGAFYNTGASRISLKLEQVESGDVNTGTALLLDSDTGLGNDNELHIQARQTDVGINIGSLGNGPRRTLIYGYSRNAVHTTDLSIATAAILASTRVDTPITGLFGGGVLNGLLTANQFPGAISLPDQATPMATPPPANTTALYVNSGSSPADDVTAFHSSGSTVDLETHGVTARGDILVTNASTKLIPLARGASNLYPKSNGTDVVYSTLPAGGAGSCSSGQFQTASNADAAPTCADPNFIDWQKPAAAVTAVSGTDVTVYTTTLPAIPNGKGIRVTVYFQHTTGSAGTVYKWKLGTAASGTFSYGTTTQTAFGRASAVIFNDPGSHTAQTLDADLMTLGTTFQAGGQALPTEDLSSGTVAVSFTFNIGNSSDKVTPMGWVVEVIQ